MVALDAWRRSLPKHHPTCRAGKSPHAPYSAGYWLYTAAAVLLGPAAIHLAETAAEAVLLERREGPYVEFLQRLGVWEGAEFARNWEEIIDTCSAEGILLRLGREPAAPPILFAHCNYLPADAPFGSNQSVVYCPRTHAAFGHPAHPFREFLNHGVRVCLATDSLASNPDLDILAEARFVHQRYPNFPGETLLRMVTLAGAEALGWADEVGSLEPGKSADLVVIPLPDRDASDPYELLFASDGPADRRTMFRGAWRN